MNQKYSRNAIWAAVIFAVFLVFGQMSGPSSNSGASSIAYSELLKEIKAGNIKEATIEGDNVFAVTNSGTLLKSTATMLDRGLINDLIAASVKFDVKNPEGPSFLSQLFISWFPMLLLIGVWVFFMMKSQGKGGLGGALSVGKSKARMLDEKSNHVTFADVAGCDEAKEEVGEIVEFLREPRKFQQLGGRVPHGVLMVGPPGTGKTLLARAIAGEAKVPFFTISGSDFVEMFVGVGASRVRDMFNNAKQHAPCIIFIDEIDAVGRQRGTGMGGGNDEREQTLNQLLVEMDGFEGNSGVIVIAATNRADVLDKALLRPGRFDRQVMVGLPDIRGREQILNVHMRNVPISKDVRADVLARGTPGFSGAELANLVNESALFAARRNKNIVDMRDFEDAKDKIIMGPERKSAVMREEERRNTAYHESGHAVVAALLPKADPVHKVTIMPRGFALGLTWQLPEHDRVNMYKDKMLEDIAILFGGRIAEEVFMNQMSTGASNDFERATKLARAMVTRYGMSEALGTMVYVDDAQDPMFGMQTTSVSEETQQKVDEEIRGILDRQYALARSLLEQNRDKVEAMTEALLEWETIDADQIEDIMKGFPPRPPKYGAPEKRVGRSGPVAPNIPATI
ncbi:MAG TPA: ATP-dependent zinc metalloprotease FtsH [Noviherbaspirillum sp.]|uniref:ATP-dependent zinc metalloprotease FtsH n=1 Tax=Noviherbaspirillum sp. TaxID=1926288 RepID=UPI002DDD0E8F|nr:ATP-dependent zinc metalloprotease FtsH [Noviherbaspirillum sp.]HEV2610174.1 ATP-dependent zinc metalloprotease FtsH [Noviherbaspirillum sp.]